SRPIPAIAPPAAGAAVDQARSAAPGASREIRMASPGPVAANDTGSAVGRREVRISPTTGQPPANSSISRVQGVGSRFRSPPSRKTEKMK
ncbi:hypothetical protein GRI89_00140, partial [Altererythrobacter salegens]|nr:hypothetical protein [Croceibacterium salegens]